MSSFSSKSDELVLRLMSSMVDWSEGAEDEDGRAKVNADRIAALAVPNKGMAIRSVPAALLSVFFFYLPRSRRARSPCGEMSDDTKPESKFVSRNSLPDHVMKSILQNSLIKILSGPRRHPFLPPAMYGHQQLAPLGPRQHPFVPTL